VFDEDLGGQALLRFADDDDASDLACGVAGAVGARVVDDDQLIRRTALRQHRVQARRQPSALVVSADDDADGDWTAIQALSRILYSW
jgi:hypothetical protein